MWRKTQKILATFIPSLLLLAYLTVAISLLNRWDAMVAVTLIPVWAWAGLGMAIALFCWILCRGLPSLLLFCLFLVSGLLFSEEPLGIARELALSIRERGKTAPEEGPLHLRLVNVNCNGSEAALRRAIEAEPDILVIQKAPGKAILDAIAEQLYGVDHSVASHLGNAILARGKMLEVITDPVNSTLHARIKRSDGFIVDVTNLDLEGCAPTLEMWRPSVWKKLIEARVLNRRLVRASLGENEITRSNIGRVISGGFGTPPGDDVYRPLESNHLTDTYGASGLGWGNTFPSEYPLLRLDQIWVSPNLVPIRSVTRLNPDSTRRIVVSEVKITLPATPVVTPEVAPKVVTPPVVTPPPVTKPTVTTPPVSPLPAPAPPVKVITPAPAPAPAKAVEPAPTAPAPAKVSTPAQIAPPVPAPVTPAKPATPAPLPVTPEKTVAPAPEPDPAPSVKSASPPLSTPAAPAVAP